MYNLLLFVVGAMTAISVQALRVPRNTSENDIPSSTYDPFTTNQDFSTSPACTGSVTYTGSVPPTVYLTTTVPYQVTVTANTSFATTPTLITPLPACSSTILPFESIFVSAPGAFSSASGGQFTPQVATSSGDFNTPQYSSPYASATPYTSTVIVTKKTPVPVSATSSETPLVFQLPSQTPSTTDAAIVESSSSSVVPIVVSTTPTYSPVQSVGGPRVVSSSGAGTVMSKEQPATVASNSQPVTPLPTGFNTLTSPALSWTSYGPPTPTTASIGNIPFTVLPTGVAVGSQTFVLPSNSPTTIHVSGQVYTIGPTAIIGPSTTYTIQRPATTISSAMPKVNGASFAYIGGSTYLVNPGTTTDKVTIGSETITLGPGGASVWTEGFAALTTVPAPSVVTADGLTFTIAASYAVVSGTTYAIGSGSLPKTIMVGSQTLSLGPSGVSDGKTTFQDTAVATKAPTANATASTSQSAAAAFQAVRVPLPLWLVSFFIISVLF